MKKFGISITALSLIGALAAPVGAWDFQQYQREQNRLHEQQLQQNAERWRDIQRQTEDFQRRSFEMEQRQQWQDQQNRLEQLERRQKWGW